MEPVFTSLFIAPCSLLVCAPMTNQAFLWRELSADFSTWLSALIYACINLRNAFHHCAQRTKHRVIFSIESDDQPVFLVSLPGLLQKASKCLVTAPSHFFFVSFRNHQCPFWNHCFNRQQIMRRRLQNKRASQLRPLNSERKRQEFLWGAWPPTTSRSFASRMRPLYFQRIRYAAVFKSLPRFQIPSIWFRISRTIPCQ